MSLGTVLLACGVEEVQLPPATMAAQPPLPTQELPPPLPTIPHPVHKPSPPPPPTEGQASETEDESLAMTEPKPSAVGSSPEVSLPPPGPAPASTSPGPAASSRSQSTELIGLDQPSATRLFGPAAERSEEPPATVWRYKNATCELDLFFYLDLRSGSMRTLHYAFKGEGGDKARRQDCLRSLLVARNE
jgi:hypothetical protein